MVKFKNKINGSLEILEVIMALDFHYEELRIAIEEQNLTELSKKLDTLSETLLILLMLPKVNPRYEKAEKIINLVIEFAKKFVSDKFDKNRQKVSKDLGTILHILR